MPTPPKLEDEGQEIVNDLIEVNLGMEGDFCPTFIITRLSLEEQTHYLKFLRQNCDVFTWNYSEMP